MKNEDTLLMELVADGDGNAFRTLIEKYQRDIYNYFLRSTGNREDAEDLAQQLFLNLFRSAGSYSPTASLRTYIYRMATNLAVSFSRKRKLRDTLSLDVLLGEGMTADPGSDLPGPAETVEAAELRRAYLAALLTLPPEWRAVMELRVGRDFSYKEIAEITGKSVPAIESILFRARTRLAEELKRFG